MVRYTVPRFELDEMCTQIRLIHEALIDERMKILQKPLIEGVFMATDDFQALYFNALYYLGKDGAEKLATYVLEGIDNGTL